MSMKRVVGAAAVAASVGISALTLNPGFVHSAPLDPTPPPCPNCHGGGPAGGPGEGSQNPRAPETPQTTEPPRTQSTPPPNTQSTPPPGTHSSVPPSTAPSGPPGRETTTPPGAETTGPPSAHTTTPPAGQTTAPPSAQTTGPSSTGARPALVAPSTQPPHPAYVPRGVYVRGDAQVGGPTDASAGFSIVGHGAPPPPPQRGFGWNDGPAPGHPPPNWDGPPPPGGWNGPPPPGGWNRPWFGPPRDVVVARADFGPFAYDTFTVIPVFNWQFGGWGFWYFGVWVPLY